MAAVASAWPRSRPTSRSSARQGARALATASSSIPPGSRSTPPGTCTWSTAATTAIQRLTATGDFTLKWGSIGAGAGQLSDSCRGGGGLGVERVRDGDRQPPGVEVQLVAGVFERAWGLGVVSNSATAGPQICIAAPCFGGYTSGAPGAFENPRGIAVDAADNVFVSDFFGGQRVQKFTSAGAFVTAWGSPGTGSGQFARPVELAVNAFGEVYVVDRDNHRIQRFSNDGAFLGSFGGQGTGNGQLNGPDDVAIEPSGNVLVADVGNFRIQRFSRTGAFLAEFDRILPSEHLRAALRHREPAGRHLHP